MRADALTGRRILVTRPRRPGQAHEPLAEALRELGADVLWLPALQIGPPDDWAPCDRAIARLASFDWVLFTSRNAVAGFDGRLRELGAVWNDHTRIAAVGGKTAEALALLGQTRVHVSPQPLAAALAESLAADCAGRRFLWPRAQLAPDLLTRALRGGGAAEVVEVPCYAARAAESDAEPVREALRQGQVDAVTFTSARSVEATLEALGPAVRQCLSLMPKVCIGPVTARVCEALGLGFALVADGSVGGLARAVAEAVGRR